MVESVLVEEEKPDNLESGMQKTVVEMLCEQR